MRLAVLVLVGVIGAGCGKPHPAAFATWFSAEPPYHSQKGTNAFDGYLRAAEMAQSADPLGTRRVSFTEGQKEASQRRLSGALAELTRATGRDCEFEFRAAHPFTPNPSHPGWRLLSRAMIWQLEDALEAADSTAITRTAKQASKFASDLLKGGAAEADLGLSLLDDIRQTLAPELGQLNPETISALAAILEADAIRDDWLDGAIENEHSSMLAGVQFVQDAYLQNKLERLQDNMGPEVREAVEYLRLMHTQSAEKQSGFFQGFANEAKMETSWVLEQSKLPVCNRTELEFPEHQSRPWRRFSKQLFRTLRPLLAKEVRTRARTQLFVLECKILSQVKSNGQAPTSLDAFGEALCLDPFTNRPFSYEADGPVFKLYSPGPDLIDNGGKTGEDYELPDLTLERGA
ncbi:MAG: hypothetical protein JNK63_05285 [Chthonomonas sp.]|nr:hypothetical protein [Chthonomonas sp.]